MREVDGGFSRLAQATVLLVADDPDDLHLQRRRHDTTQRAVLPRQCRDALADRVFVREIAAPKRFIDYHHARRIGLVAFIEPPAAEQRDAHRLKIAFTDGPVLRDRLFSLHRRSPLNKELCWPSSFERQKACGVGRLRAGQGPQARDKRGVKLRDLAPVAVTRKWKLKVEGQYIAGIETRVYALQPHKTLEQKPRAEQQHHGDGDLGDHERAPNAASAGL